MQYFSRACVIIIMLEQPRVIELPKIVDLRGNLSVIEGGGNVPFSIARAYWLYDVPGGEHRAGHAYRCNKEFIVALSGSFDIEVTNGKNTMKYSLNRSYYGLYIPNGWWRTLENFSTNSVALVLASCRYNDEDYIYDYDDFLKEDFKNCLCTPNTQIIQSTPSVLNTPKDARELSVQALPKVTFREGNITALNGSFDLPFEINRVFYSYDIPAGVSRGAHAHKRCHQFIVAASGSFQVRVDDGKNHNDVLLNRPFQGLHVPPGVWSEEMEFSSGSICLVLASEHYDEEEYIREYSEYLTFAKEK